MLLVRAASCCRRSLVAAHGRMRWRGSPSSASKTVRKAFMPVNDPPESPAEHRRVEGAAGRWTIGKLKELLSGVICCITHRRCCENDAGRPSRSAALMPCPSGRRRCPGAREKKNRWKRLTSPGKASA